jgi:A/G-specific adenine glycosylase
VSIVGKLGVYEHSYSHFRVRVHAFECHLIKGKPRALEHTEIRWVRAKDLGRFPMGKVDRAIARTLWGLGNEAGNRPSPRQGRS